jgi:hypothetical protein
MQRTSPLFVSLLLTSCVASQDPGAPGASDDDDPVEIENVTRIMPNGMSFNGTSFAGTTLSGVIPIGAGANGAMVAIDPSGAPLSGAGAIGSRWKGHTAQGSAVILRIDAALPGVGRNADVWAYQMSVSVKDMWQPLCPGGGFADTVRGTWNLAQGVAGGGAYNPSSSEFTVACRGSSVAKCVELGYKPWTGATAELASCVRALRGDYCGDGTSYTVDGTIVNLFDVLGIQSDSAMWAPEAEWTPDGARCVSRKENTRFFQIAHRTPSCFQITLDEKNSCGSSFTGEATMITELPRR